MAFCFCFFLFCPEVAITINMRQGDYQLDGYVKEYSFMDKLKPKK